MKRLLYILLLITVFGPKLDATETASDGSFVMRKYLRVRIVNIVEPIDIPLYDGMECTIDPIALRVHSADGWLGFNFPHVESYSYITKEEPAPEPSGDDTTLRPTDYDTTSVQSVSDDAPGVILRDHTLTVTRQGEHIRCRLYDTRGVMANETSGDNSISIALNSLTPDIYVAVINDDVTFKICVR